MKVSPLMKGELGHLENWLNSSGRRYLLREGGMSEGRGEYL